jgi:hypothetical protein
MKLPQKTKRMVKEICKHLKHKRFSELTKDDKKVLKGILKKLYWDYNLSLRKIALLLKKDYDTIYKWFIKLGIRKRTLKEAALLRRNPTRQILLKLLPSNLQLEIKKCRKKIRPKKVDIPSNLLKELYVNQKLSAIKIGILLGVSKGTIERLLRKSKIKARKSVQKRTVDKKKRKVLLQRVPNDIREKIDKIYRKFQRRKSLGLLINSEDIPSEILEYLYLKCKLSLSEIGALFGLGSSKIRKRLKRCNIPRRSVSEALTKYQKRPFIEDSREMTKFKCYLLGARCGDLYALLDDRRVVCIISTTHPAWEKLMNDLFRRFGPIRKRPFENRKGEFAWQISAYLDISFSFLLKRLSLVPFWILSDQELFLSFLAGVMDSEGCISLDSYNNYPRFRISISLTDKELLKNLEDGLRNLGFSPILYKGKMHSSHFGKKPIWNLCIERKKELKRLLTLLLPFLKHEEKITKAKIALKSDNKSIGEIKREWQIILARIEKSVRKYKELAETLRNSKLS